MREEEAEAIPDYTGCVAVMDGRSKGSESLNLSTRIAPELNPSLESLLRLVKLSLSPVAFSMVYK